MLSVLIDYTSAIRALIRHNFRSTWCISTDILGIVLLEGTLFHIALCCDLLNDIARGWDVQVCIEFGLANLLITIEPAQVLLAVFSDELCLHQ